jgi:hypothetical protein
MLLSNQSPADSDLDQFSELGLVFLTVPKSLLTAHNSETKQIQGTAQGGILGSDCHSDAISLSPPTQQQQPLGQQ